LKGQPADNQKFLKNKMLQSKYRFAVYHQDPSTLMLS